MRIYCGASQESMMAHKQAWHPWFAWFPVRVGDRDRRWLETVERKGTYHESGIHGPWFSFECRALHD